MLICCSILSQCAKLLKFVDAKCRICMLQVVDGLLGWIRVELLIDGILIALIILRASASVDVKLL